MYEGFEQDIESLYETNKFGYKYLRLDKKPSKRLVDFFAVRYNINTDCHYSCHTCQITQILKYLPQLEMENSKSIKDTGKPLVKWFPVKCSYIPKGLKGETRAQISEIAHNLSIDEDRAKRIMLSSIDPAAWTELMFGFDDKTQIANEQDEAWYLRWYQKHLVRCLQEDQYVFMYDGTIRKIKDIQVGDKVIAYDEVGRRYFGKRVLNKIYSGKKSIYKITIENGDVLECTEDHPIFSYSFLGKENKKFQKPSLKTGYLSIKDGLGQSIDDRIYIATKFENFGKENNILLAKLLGYIVTDGYVSFTSEKNVVQFANIRKQYTDEFVELVNALFIDCNVKYKIIPSHIGNDGSLRQETYSAFIYGKNNSLFKFLNEIGCTNKTNRENSIIEFAFTFSKEALCNFINRCWSGDGCVSITHNKNSDWGDKEHALLTLSSGNEDFLKKFRLLLRKISISSCHIYRQHKDSRSLGLNISRTEEIKIFFEEVGLIYGKEDNSSIAFNLSTIHRNKKGKFTSSGRFKIKTIEAIGEKDVYDIEVEDRHNFIAEGIIVHNCSSHRLVSRQGRRSGKSASIIWKLIWYIYNHKVFAGYNAKGEKLYRGPEIIVITPFTSQVKNIFSQIERFLKLNKDLADEVHSRGGKLYTQTPPLKMEFKNGASITGYVSGANAKDDDTGGGIIRGDDADIIYLDEMDMIPDSILQKVIMPLLITRPNVILLGSSTPIGKKASFHKWCLNSSYFKEIYVPSTVLPQWDAVEREILDESTGDSFKAEYMADFIEQQSGVFKHRYIQEARTDYEYSQTEDPEFWTKEFGENFYQFRICIGIDWNKNAGTEYVVAAFSPRTGKFYLLETINMPPSEYSSDGYKDEVKRLNYKWKPNYIYADEGYGHTMIEDLQVEALNLAGKHSKTPLDQATIMLQERLKKLNFSSNIELLNPSTGTYFTKYAKNFLVENAVKLMERTRVKFPENDNVLIKQLGNYIVEKQLDNGKLVYGQNNIAIGDHRLDAFILAVGGLAIEESIYSTNYGVAPDTYHIPNEKDKEEFTSSMEDALSILKVLKKQKSGIQLDVLAIRRGNGSVEQERHIYNQSKWEEEKENYSTGKVSRSNLERVPGESGKGYFSKKGLAKLSETRKGEEIDANYMFEPPIKISAPNNRGRIRTKLNR